MTLFARCLPVILTFEGGYADDPIDPGGATNCGITQASYTFWRLGEHLTKRAVSEVTPGEVTAIYFGSYWKPMGCDALDPSAALVVFDSAVQHGVVKARQFLAEVGPLADALCDRRMRYYRAIVAAHPQQWKFLNGWTRRIATLRAIAHAWSEVPPPPQLAA